MSALSSRRGTTLLAKVFHKTSLWASTEFRPLAGLLSFLLILAIYPGKGYAERSFIEINHALFTTEENDLERGRKCPGENPLVVDPVITVRFGNPAYNCNTLEYCLDVQFQSDVANKRLFGMNVRFFYDENILELINFRNYEPGYGPAAPNPPLKSTSASAGPALFNFAGPAEYINGAIILSNINMPPVYISTTGWTKIFQICFTIDNVGADPFNFCPPIVWDLEQNPANGGFLPGSDGVVMTVLNASGGSDPVTENVNQFNWVYIGNGPPPYGQPQPSECISASCIPLITCPVNVTISCGASTLPANTGTATATDYCAGDPVITYTDAISGGPCPAGSVITRTWNATDNCSNSATCNQIITVTAGGGCNLVVSSTADSGPNTLRAAIECAAAGDTILFHSSIGGMTINITSTKIVLDKNLYIRCNLGPRVKVASQIAGLFEIAAGKTIEMKDLDITSGLTVPNNDGAAFTNNGTLKFINVKVFRNASLPSGQYLIRNKPSSQLTLNGNSFIHYN